MSRRILRLAFGFLRRTAAWCALAALLALPAHAEVPGKPMTFEWRITYDDVPAIFADGELTPETPAALRSFLARNTYPTRDRMIYFNSLGGDLGAGMEVGRIIRRSELNTGVARATRAPDEVNMIDLDLNSGVYPGHCVSACSLAFLGGVKREVRRGSIFAVHQVSMNCVDRAKAHARYPWIDLPNVNYCPGLDEALTMMQVANGVVVEYVRSMGVDPFFLAEMSKAAPDAINTLPEDKLREYRIVFEYRTESWEFKTDTQGQLYLQYLQGDQWRQDKVEIYCDRSEAPRLFLWLVHDINRSTGPIDGNRIVELAGRGLSAVWQLDAQTQDGFADVRQIALQPYEIINQPRLTERGNIALTIDLSPRFLDVMSGATRFQILTTDADIRGREGFNLITITLDRDKLAGMIRFCK